MTPKESSPLLRQGCSEGALTPPRGSPFRPQLLSLSAYLHHVLEFAGLRVLQEQSLQHLLEAADGLLVEGLRHKRACEAKATTGGGAVPGGQARQSVCLDTTQGSLLRPGELPGAERLPAAAPFFLHVNEPLLSPLLPCQVNSFIQQRPGLFCE